MCKSGESSSVAISGNSFKRVQIKTDPASCTAYFSPEMSSETHFQQVSKLAAMLVQFDWSSTQCWLGSWASAFGHVLWAFYGCLFHPQSWYYHQIPINLFICNRCYLDCATTFPNSLKYFEMCSRHWIQNKHILTKNNTCGTFFNIRLYTVFSMKSTQQQGLANYHIILYLCFTQHPNFLRNQGWVLKP